MAPWPPGGQPPPRLFSPGPKPQFTVYTVPLVPLPINLSPTLAYGVQGPNATGVHGLPSVRGNQNQNATTSCLGFPTPVRPWGNPTRQSIRRRRRGCLVMRARGGVCLIAVRRSDVGRSNCLHLVLGFAIGFNVVSYPYTWGGSATRGRLLLTAVVPASFGTLTAIPIGRRLLRIGDGDAGGPVLILFSGFLRCRV